MIINTNSSTKILLAAEMTHKDSCSNQNSTDIHGLAVISLVVLEFNKSSALTSLGYSTDIQELGSDLPCGIQQTRSLQ